MLEYEEALQHAAVLDAAFEVRTSCGAVTEASVHACCLSATLAGINPHCDEQ